jgi:hypothetical protein
MMNARPVKLPKYVLLHQGKKFGPQVLETTPRTNGIAIYGFSEKATFDAFCQLSKQALTPYPLVKRYLRDQIEAACEKEAVVVVDATSPEALELDGVSMTDLLAAIEHESPDVAVRFRFTKELQSDKYQIAASEAIHSGNAESTAMDR